ncbi:glycosyltransferase family 2 protein [Oxobacter pfennigii]|nr:glycosyltransferase family 2 protein [Oxobacter pfennigii]
MENLQIILNALKFKERMINLKLYTLLPCYNEGEALPKLLNSMNDYFKIRKLKYEIVIINDGSTDGTLSEAKKWQGDLNIKILNHEGNKGLGEAVHTGLFYFLNICNSGDYAVVMDADNTHNPMIIDSMLDKMKSGCDVVIASRYEEGGEEIGLSLLRRMFSFGANTLLNAFFNIKNVKDYTCGYRMYSATAIKKAYAYYSDSFIEESGFTCMAEILIKLNHIGLIIKEVPLILRYDQKMGKSKMKVIKTIRRYFFLLRTTKKYRPKPINKPVLLPNKQK